MHVCIWYFWCRTFLHVLMDVLSSCNVGFQVFCCYWLHFSLAGGGFLCCMIILVNQRYDSWSLYLVYKSVLIMLFKACIMWKNVNIGLNVIDLVSPSFGKFNLIHVLFDIFDYSISVFFSLLCSWCMKIASFLSY